MVSIGIEKKWKRDIIEGSLYSVIEVKEEKTFVSNVFKKEQLNEQFDQKMQKISIWQISRRIMNNYGICVKDYFLI